MATRLPTLAVTALLVALAGTNYQAAPAGPPLFNSDEPVAFQLKAAFNDLFDHARTDDAYSVAGTLSYAHDGREVTIDGVKLSLRGNTSKRENECAFPKLKVDLPPDKDSVGPLLAGMDSLKIGTHCGEAADDMLTAKYGRMSNERSPLREVFIYRLLDSVGVPTLKARPAKITYVYADPRPAQTPAQEQPLVRGAMVLEGGDDAVKRYGGTREIEETAFVNARTQFAVADTVRLALAQAMIGNFDWCLKMTPSDAYRCDARHPLWNIIAVASDDGKVRPVIYDFDVSGMVVGRHPWFKTVFSRAFSRAQSEIEVEVLAQVQRTRSLFARADLDAARAEFMQHKDAAYKTLASATLDKSGREVAKAYLDGFFGAIATDDAFYRPVVTATGAKLYANENRAPLCASRGTIPIGTPVSDPLQTKGGMVQVHVLDALWHWAPPVKCPAVQQGPVWIDADAISRDYPKAQERPQ
jgi:hypothetical protein